MPRSPESINFAFLLYVLKHYHYPLPQTVNVSGPNHNARGARSLGMNVGHAANNISNGARPMSRCSEHSMHHLWQHTARAYSSTLHRSDRAAGGRVTCGGGVCQSSSDRQPSHRNRRPRNGIRRPPRTANSHDQPQGPVTSSQHPAEASVSAG